MSSVIQHALGRRPKLFCKLAVLGLLAGMTAALSAATSAQNSHGVDQFVPGRVLLKFQPGVTPARGLQIVFQMHAQLEDQIAQIEVLQLRLPPGLSEQIALDRFRQFPEVSFVELDYWRPPEDGSLPARIPSDPNYPNQWHLSKVQLPVAWNTTTGATELAIAVLDTGVDASHPDLAEKLLPGWNFFDNNDVTDDVYGHGTMVAGIAAASSDNSLGVASAAWGCRILPIRISDASGWASDSMIAAGLTWAADQGAKVANISYAVTASAAVTSAAQYFQSKGGLVVVAAGNEGIFTVNADNPYMLTVGATDSSDTVAAWSNAGNNLDLVAPGVNMLTTSKDNGYAESSGTSFSAPLVAGTAALVMSSNPALSPAQVQGVLKQSSFDLGSPGWDGYYGWGRLDAAEAVSRAMTYDIEGPTVTISSPVAAAIISGTVIVRVSATDNVAVAKVTYSVDGEVIGESVNAPFDFTWNTLKVANGARNLTAVAEDAAGNTAGASVAVTVKNSDGTRPTVKILSPASKATVSGIIVVKVSATDNNMVASVSLSIGGKLYQTLTKGPYEFIWDTTVAVDGVNLYTNGTQVLLAKATDGVGNYSTASISVILSNPDAVPPIISITSPTDASTTTLSKLPVYHSYSDNQKVTKVELYVDGVRKTSTTTAPFKLTYSVLSGTHRLQSKAYDAKGNIGVSNIVTVTK